MRIRDDELHAPEAAPRDRAQELGPERLGLGRADHHAENLAATIAVDARGDDDGDRDDPPILPYFEIGRIEPDVGPVTLDRPIEEGFDLLVDLGAEPAYLVELRIPKLRQGSYFPTFLEPRRMAEKALTAVSRLLVAGKRAGTIDTISD